MSGPIHFVDITGTLQELGPGAHIQFNARNGTRQEIVLVGRSDLDETLTVIKSLELARQHLLERESDLRSRLSASEQAGRTAERQAQTLGLKLDDSTQRLSDDIMSIRQSLDAVESQILHKISCVWNTLGPVQSLSTANSAVIEELARELSNLSSVLSRPSDFDEQNRAHILGMGVRFDEELPNVWETISNLRHDVDSNDRWATAKAQSLFDFMNSIERDLLTRCASLRKMAIFGISAAIISTVISVVALLV